MRKPYLPALLLAFVMALSGCATHGGVQPPPVCPRLQPAPEATAPRIDYVKKVQDELLDSLPNSKQKGMQP